MNKKFLLLLTPFLLASCGSNNAAKTSDDQTPTQEAQEQGQTGGNTEEHIEGGGETEQHTEGGGGETGGGTQQEENPNPVTTNLSLDEWQNWYFSENNEPTYVDDWDFYYGDSHKPNGCLWENPTYKQYSGIEFQKNCYAISPEFNTYTKVEMRFYFWFSSHQSDKYHATDNKPQFVVEEYDANDKLLGTYDINIARSDVPKDNKPKECRVYVENNKMTWFKLKFNNFIPNSQGGYTAILTQVGLKGYNY